MSTKLVADIALSQRPIKGLKPKAWIFNAGEVTITKTDNKITNLVKVAGKKAFTVEGFKDFMNAGFEPFIAENMPNSFKHIFTLQYNAATAAEKANIDNVDNIIVIVEKNAGCDTSEGAFLAYGICNGLWKTAQSKKANDNNGMATVEFATREGQGETYSEYVVWKTDYATTLAALVAAETV